MDTKVKFLPVYGSDGFLAGVYKAQDSNHDHRWDFMRVPYMMARCRGCQLHVRVYTIQEAMELTK